MTTARFRFLLVSVAFLVLSHTAALAAEGARSASPVGSPAPLQGRLYVIVSPLSTPGASAIVRFDVPAVGAPVQQDVFETGGNGGAYSSPQGVAFAATGHFLYACNNLSGDVSAFTIVSDGTLQAVTGSPFAVGSGPLGMALHPILRVLYVTTWMDGRVHVLSIHDDGSLSESQTIQASGPGDCKVDPTGRFLYVSDLEAGVRGYAISGTGELSELPGSPFHYAPSPFRTIAVEVAPDGRRVFALDIDLGLVAFDVGLSGELSLLPGSPRAIGSPADVLELTPDGTFLFVGTFDPNGLNTYTVGAAGLPSPIGNPLATPSMVDAIAPATTSKLFGLRRDTRAIAEYAIAGDGALTPSFGSIPVIDGQGRAPNGAAFVPCVISYRDADGDGYGDLADSLAHCDSSTPTGYVVDSTDCDDTNPAIHPGATELCNGIDDNCDGTMDNGGNALCVDGDDCTTDLCASSSGCVHSVANMDLTDFSAERVDGRDLTVLADAWNSCPGDPAFNPAANLDQAGCVDVTDFHLFMTTFGRSCS